MILNQSVVCNNRFNITEIVNLQDTFIRNPFVNDVRHLTDINWASQLTLIVKKKQKTMIQFTCELFITVIVNY